MATELLQGVPQLLKVCIDPLPGDNNQKFARGSPTDLYLPLGPTQFFGSPNNSIIFFCMKIDTEVVGLISPSTSLSSMIFETFIVIFIKPI